MGTFITFFCVLAGNFSTSGGTFLVASNTQQVPQIAQQITARVPATLRTKKVFDFSEGLQAHQLVPTSAPLNHNAGMTQGEPRWGVFGLELAGLFALGGYALGRLSQPSVSPTALQSGQTGKGFNWAAALPALLLTIPPEACLAAEQASTGYSLASYYTALGTYVLALPGLFSLVTRSVKAKIVRKTFVMPGTGAGGMSQKEIAGKLLFFLTTKRGFELKEAGQVVTFKGKLAKRNGQAGFLTFCVFLSLLSLGLVLQTVETASLGEGQGLGNWWYAVSLISPLAGKYYLDNAGGDQEIQVKIVSDDAEKETEVTIQGDDVELETLRLEFDWQEKGMVRVKGLLEDSFRGGL